MERWAGRVALVTGASCGIGASVAMRLAANGMKVVGCGRSVDRIQELSSGVASASQGKIYPIQCDLEDESQILDMFATIKTQHGGVDVCINNAGLSLPDASILSGNTASWKKILDVNVTALCICTREAYQSMKERNVDDGHIINVSSLSGHRLLNTGVSFYGATKHCVRALTEGTRKEIRASKSHIRVSSVSPGVVKTEFFERAKTKKDAEKLFKTMECLKPEDIADAIVYALASPPHIEVNDIMIRPTEQVT